MELRIVILSVACFSCLVPSVLSTGILTAKAAAKGAALAKGAMVAKGAVALTGAAVGKGLMLAKGALAAKGVAIAKGAMLAKGALAAKGALVAKGVLAAKGLLAAKKAIAAKGLMIVKGAASALVAKGIAAKVAAVKGAVVLAKNAAAKVVATKIAAVKSAVGAAKGLAVAKVAAASGVLSKPLIPLPIPVVAPVGFRTLIPVLSPLSAVSGRRSFQVQQAVAVDPAAAIASRIGEWAGAISGAVVKQNEAANELVSAITSRVNTNPPAH